ncbi:peptidyl-prolyl cis-trans isomerase FKBP8-like isoform X2 [Asterias rubens]|nr:peptidyl-prolyl cis-trans isomerase FKBP8-like isoform X2 [Asterias rubens]
MEEEKVDSQLGGSDADDPMSISKTEDHHHGDENKQDTPNGHSDDHENPDDDDDDDDSDMPELIDSKPKSATNIEEIGRTEDANKKTSPVNDSDSATTKQEDPEWMDVLGNGALKKKLLKAGQGAATRPQRGELVTLRSKGALDDGSEVDCHESITFVLGEGDVVSAWELCLSLMELGEVAVLKTTPRFAYGENGRTPDIPPNADITYELELLKVEEAPDLEEMSGVDLCSVADKKRERGNELYSRKDYSGAINSYTMALKLLEGAMASEEEASRKAVSELKIKCFNNLAAAQLKIDAYDPALKSCTSVLDLDSENVKALFRKGKVLACLGEYEDAVKTMKEALAKEPSNKVIHQELSRLTSSESKQRQSERQLYQRMVGDMASVTQVNSKKSISMWLVVTLSIVVVIIAIAAAISTKSFELLTW